MCLYKNTAAVIIAICTSFWLIGCSKESKKAQESGAANDIASPKSSYNISPHNNLTNRHSESEAKSKNTYTTIEWTDLLPDEDLKALKNPPGYLNDIEDGSEADQLPSQFKIKDSRQTIKDNPAEKRYQQALTSTSIRPEYNGRSVRIPGFIVPLEFDDQQTITTFFLVPFFGACIHYPPPPPNQIIYAEYEPGIQLEELYDPFWISGELSTSLIENDMATAAYTVSVSTIEPYAETAYTEIDGASKLIESEQIPE